MSSYKMTKLSDFLKGKSTGEKLPSLVDLALIEAILEIAAHTGLSDEKLNTDIGVARTDYGKGDQGDSSSKADTIDFKVDNN